MTRIAVVVGSTRPGRRARVVAEWVLEHCHEHEQVASGDVTVELLDLLDYGLPLLDEPSPPIFGRRSEEHSVRWAEAVAGFDGFVFVTPEYNHSLPAALKNAVDFLFAEWNHKAAGIVSYGVHGGTRAAEHLRLVLAEVRSPCVRSQVVLQVFGDFEFADPTDPTDIGRVVSSPRQVEALGELLDEVLAWSAALAPLRAG
jgi:NAD(P)H-dependent FMN reductase